MPLKSPKISDIGEKRLIKLLQNRYKEKLINSFFFDELSFKSLNDDSGLINLGDEYLAVTSDLLLEKSHFPPSMTFFQCGKKIVTVNVSDLAAMGAKPLGIVIALGLKPNMLLSDFIELMDGIIEACEEYNITLLGGDTNEARELTLCGTAIGLIDKEKVLMRSGAQEGDIIAVSGPLGLAAAGFKLLKLNEENIQTLVREKVIKSALEPKARLELGIRIADTGAVSSATDITDGLLSEIGEMIEANEGKVGFRIHEEMIPIPPEVYIIATKIDIDPLELALSYGEDFELLLTIKPALYPQIKEEFDLYTLGEVDSSGKINMIDKEGRIKVYNAKGFQHFADNI